MNNNILIEKSIAHLIEKDFPAYYREEGPVFVAFVRTYYDWLESLNKVNYHARRLMEYGDVDDTLDSFIVYFKEKYLKGIQFETQTNTRQLIKHTLDLYRSKGTERSVELLFALVFGEQAEVYYPGSDIFTLSSGDWVRPQYLEVTSRPINESFVGKQVVGTKSKAVAFVERLIRRKIKSKYIEVFYISAIKGNFQFNEIIKIEGVNVKKCPRIIGSLTSFDMIDRGQGFSVGDIVSISSNNGVQGKGRVAGVESITGLVDFELVDGGWGYSANAEVLVSEKVLALSNVVVTQPDANTNYPLQPFELFETIIQPINSLQYEYANGTFSNGASIYMYYGNNDLAGRGIILSAANSNTTAGTLTVRPNFGNLESNVIFYTSGNAVTANVVAAGFTDLTATANVIGWNSSIDLSIEQTNGTFLIGETVVQTGLGNVVVASAVVNGFTISAGSGILKLESTNGVFKSEKTVTGLDSDATTNAISFGMLVGVKDISNNDFSTISKNYIYGQNTSISGTILRISQGTGASFGISNNLLNSEEVRVDVDLVRNFLDVEIDGLEYGLSGDFTANSGDIILDSLAIVNVEIGTITSINSENPGSDYDTAPIVTIFEPYIAPLWKKDYIFNIANTTGTFIVGEQITQSNTLATGIVKTGSNSSVLYIERSQYNDTFDNTHPITGETSAATANVIYHIDDSISIEIGLNANVTSNVVGGNGVITTLDVYDSGFGYEQDELATFTSSDGLRSGRVRINLNRQGRSEGYYRNTDGFLSDVKRLYDGEYYQQYSYEVRSSVALDKYKDMLKHVIHVAGTKMFGAFVNRTVANNSLELVDSSITIES